MIYASPDTAILAANQAIFLEKPKTLGQSQLLHWLAVPFCACSILSLFNIMLLTLLLFLIWTLFFLTRFSITGETEGHILTDLSNSSLLPSLFAMPFYNALL